MADYTGTTASEAVIHTSDTTGKIWDFSQGGDDTLTAGSGNDTFIMGGELRSTDQIDGGTGTSNTVTIGGNYTNHTEGSPPNQTLFLNALEIATATFTSIENLILQEGAGYAYDITMDANADPNTFGALVVDARTLTTANLIFDATSATGDLYFEIGTSPIALTGGMAANTFVFEHAPQANQFVDGNAASPGGTAQFDSSGAQTFTLDAAHFNHIKYFDMNNGGYAITAADDLTASGQTTSIYGSFAVSLNFDGSAEKDGQFNITGSSGDDTLQGGGGNDTIAPAGGNATIDAGGGDDSVGYNAHRNTTVNVDGGAGNDTVSLTLTHNDPVTLEAASLQHVETLAVEAVQTGVGYKFNLTLDDGAVTAGAVLAVDISPTFAPTDIDASAVSSGALIFTLQDAPASDNTIVAGGGNDRFLVQGHGGTERFNGYGGDDTLSLGGTLDAFDFIDGGAGNDTAVLDGDYSAGVTLHALTLTNVETLRLQYLSTEIVNSYKLTTADGTVAAGATLTVIAQQLTAGATVTFDGHSETDGHFYMIGGAGNDMLTGGHLGDTLNGGGGIDSLTGGSGNDAYFVDNAADRVFEAISGGTDTVFASLSYQLANGQSVEVLATSLQAGTTQLSLSGNDLAQRINGNEGINGLYGGAGNDSLYGYGGNDRLVGGAGHDVMDGGTGNDVFAFGAVADSTGVTRDLIQNMNLTAADRFQFTVKPTAGIHTAVIHGALNEGSSFDANLGGAIHDAAQLDAHQAVLFTPDGGTLAHHVFLILDVNGAAGYQAGADYVVELQGVAGALTTDDFA